DLLNLRCNSCCIFSRGLRSFGFTNFRGVLRPVSVNGFTCSLYRSSQGERGLAHNRITGHARENSHFVPVPQISFSALMVEYSHIIRLSLNVVRNYVRASFAKSFYDFRRLRAGAAMGLSSERSATATAMPNHFPRFAVGNEHAGVVHRGGI